VTPEVGPSAGAGVAYGIDIGGTNIKGLAVTPKGRVLSEMNMATEDSGGKKWLANVKLASDRTREGLREAPAWIGLAAPGIAAPDQRSISYMPERLPGLEGLVWRRVHEARVTATPLEAG